MRWRRPRGLRARIVVGFTVGALLVSAVLVGTTFSLARNYLLDQRERSATRLALVDATQLASRLSTAGAEVGDVLGELVPSGGSDVVVHDGDQWFSSGLTAGARDVPAALQQLLADGSAGTARTDSADGPRLVVGVRLPGSGVDFYELAPLAELQQSLRTLAGVLLLGAAAATAAGAAFGVYASRRAVQPLEQVATAAARITAGELGARLPETDDPELVAIVASFNGMVDALAARIARDARFVGDVSHELRSPLTSLVTSVEVLGARQDELSARSRQALSLVRSELGRFHRTLDDLLELARLDDAQQEDAAAVSVGAVAREVLGRAGASDGVLSADPDEAILVALDKNRLERAVRNLVDNAERHAGGVTAVEVRRREGTVVLHVDDAGPGVLPADRERVFERFARGPRATRGSLPGAGLGLAIVTEIAGQGGGAAWVSDSPAGGARFTLALPGAER